MRRSISSLAAVLLLGACTDATGPRLAYGYYGASTINGQAGQVLLGATANCDDLLWRTSMGLNEDGTFSLGGLRIDDCTRGGGGVSASVTQLTGTWRRDGDQLTFSLPGAAPFTGRVGDGHIDTRVPPGPATFPIVLEIAFTWYPVPPP